MERTPLLTFITPVGLTHLHLVERVKQSVLNQTVPCKHLLYVDKDKRGPAHWRNVGIQEADTPFISLLDADDEVLPEFAHRTLSAWKPNRFVFSDWFDQDKPFKAPKCPWMANTRNIITTLVYTEDALRVGDFDETLNGMEDTDWYLRLLSLGVCGLHVPMPLFRYHKDGQRSAAFYQTPEYHAVIRRFNRDFERLKMADSSCGGCGGGSPYAMPEASDLPVGEQQPGDVLVQALYSGNTAKRGVMSGRLYPRLSHPKTLWIDPRDLAAAPHLFKSVVDMPPALDTLPDEDFQQFANQVRARFSSPMSQQHTPRPLTVQAQPVEVRPDVQQVLRLYERKA